MSIDNPGRILISRTDSIGDVILTLPICGILKEKFPKLKIIFLGRSYTKPVIECCPHVDEIWDWDDLKSKDVEQITFRLKDSKIDTVIHVFPNKYFAKLVKLVKIENRIGTSHRLYHRFTCNYRPGFTRKRSDLHEAQLNTKLLSPFGLDREYHLNELTKYASFQFKGKGNASLNSLIKADKKNLILHPKSQGSAVEWPLDNFISLASTLDPFKYEIFFTGTEAEGKLFRNALPTLENVHDLSGKLTLSELIDFIGRADCLVAASTGPLHIAGFCGIQTVGLFSSVRPIHAGRWKPLGINTLVYEDKKNSKTAQPLEIDYRDIVQEVQ